MVWVNPELKKTCAPLFGTVGSGWEVEFGCQMEESHGIDGLSSFDVFGVVVYVG